MEGQVRDGVPIGDANDGGGSLLQLYFTISVDNPQQRPHRASILEILVVELIGHPHRG